MARNLQVDEQVFIPKSKIGIKNVEGSAFRQCRVVAVADRTITIDLVNDEGKNVSVASSVAQRNIRVSNRKNWRFSDGEYSSGPTREVNFAVRSNIGDRRVCFAN